MGPIGSPGLRLTGLARVKNEGDVIEEFVRYNVRFLDALVVVDNLSFDGTRDILEALRREGLPLTILDDPCFGNHQARCVTNVAAQLLRQPVDFVFLLDADEFIAAPSRARLESALAALPRGAHGALPWASYVPTPADDAGVSSVLRRITHRRRVESAPFSKVVVARRGYRAAGGMSISQGNHHVVLGGGRIDPGIPLEGVRLAHFPVRSLRQVQTKALIGWTTYLAMGYDNEDEIGYQKRRLYDMLCAKPQLDEEAVHRIALTYLDRDGARSDAGLVYDPLEPAERLRYGDRSMPDLAHTSVAFTRQMARVIFESTEARLIDELLA